MSALCKKTHPRLGHAWAPLRRKQCSDETRDNLYVVCIHAVYLRKSRQCELLTNVQPGLSHASSRAKRVRHMISHYTISSRSSKQLPVPERTTFPNSVHHVVPFPDTPHAVFPFTGTKVLYVYYVLPFSFRLERTCCSFRFRNQSFTWEIWDSSKSGSYCRCGHMVVVKESITSNRYTRCFLVWFGGSYFSWFWVHGLKVLVSLLPSQIYLDEEVHRALFHIILSSETWRLSAIYAPWRESSGNMSTAYKRENFMYTTYCFRKCLVMLLLKIKLKI